MASVGCRFSSASSRLLLHHNPFAILRNGYGTHAPVHLGGKIWKKNMVKDIAEPIEKPPTFDEKLAAKQPPADPELTKPINIGSSILPERVSTSDVRKRAVKNRMNKDLEFAARHGKIKLDLDEVSLDWLQERAPRHVRSLADHYGIYEHLFNGAYFIPTKQMHVAYDYDEQQEAPVYHGNDIPADLTAKPPCVDFEAESDTLWTLLMTNPDGHLSDNSKEALHWLIGNIKGSDIGSGQVLCPYLQPFPVRGTGYHRVIFILFQQSKELDFSPHKRQENSPNLEERTFETLEFYREYEDELTPMALNFFQTEWDESVRDVFLNVFDLLEPGYEYRYPPPYHPRQKTYPYRQPFDRYYDRYRDKKDLAEEVLRAKLKDRSPFVEPTEPKYPVLHIYKHHDPKYKPTWLRRREELMARRQEQFKDLS